MQAATYRKDLFTTVLTLATGMTGAALGYWLSAPVYVLTGPAILISVLSLAGIRFAIPNLLRDAAFVVIGIGIGAGVNSDVMAAMLHWPLAFLVLAATIVAILLVCRFLLMRFFGLDHQSAVLAATPGHLSFVLSMSAILDLNVARIVVIQSIRLLAMTLLVPFAALLAGVELGGTILPPGTPMDWLQFGVLAAISIVAGLLFQRLRVPAAMLMGAMVVSSIAHLLEYTPGSLHPHVALVAFTILGTLIGTRFSGISSQQLKESMAAGLTITIASAVLAALAAIPVSMMLEMPVTHVLVAFAPGGFETMVAMGVVLGASPGFVAACHVARLLVLPMLVPLVLRSRNSRI